MRKRWMPTAWCGTSCVVCLEHIVSPFSYYIYSLYICHDPLPPLRVSSRVYMFFFNKFS